MKLYFLTYLARPKVGSESFESYDGAYINCWINAESEAQAAGHASASIARAGWVVESLEQSSIVTREDYADDNEGLQYFEQALIDKELYVFHTWPSSPQEDDSVD
jgi:hypothetical protein